MTLKEMVPVSDTEEDSLLAQEALDYVLHNRMVRFVKSCKPDLEKPDLDQGRRGWVQATYKHVLPVDPDSQLVLEYAIDHFNTWRKNVHSQTCADEIRRMNATMQFASLGSPDPEGFGNCLPPSIAACKSVLRVPSLDTYLIHVFPTGCKHWWTYMRNSEKHFKECDGCSWCRCPYCGASHFMHDKKDARGQSAC